MCPVKGWFSPHRLFAPAWQTMLDESSRSSSLMLGDHARSNLQRAAQTQHLATHIK